MNKKVLPFVIPITACYPATSGASGILFTDELIVDWMFNCFIQIFQVESNNAIDYYDFAIDNNPFLSYNEISYSFINNNWKSMKDFVISCINDDYYVRIFNNMKKNSLYKTEKDFQHDILIYGYDNNQCKLHVADHFRNGKFEENQCLFEEFENAIDTYKPELFKSNPAFLNSVQIIKKEDNMDRLRYSMYTSEEMNDILTLNLNRIVESLEDYLSGRPTVNWYTRGRVMDNRLEKSHKWGIDCYKILSMYADNSGKEKDDFATQSFYLVYNHKLVMLERLKKINEFYVFDNFQGHLKNYEYLKVLTNRLMLLYIKMRYIKEKKVLSDRMKQLLKEIVELEYEYMEMLINDLKNHAVKRDYGKG